MGDDLRAMRGKRPSGGEITEAIPSIAGRHLFARPVLRRQLALKRLTLHEPKPTKPLESSSRLEGSGVE